MGRKQLAFALCMIAGAMPVSAASQGPLSVPGAPAGTPGTRYCMRVEAFTGTLVEQVKCWTRREWAEQGVDVDRDWAREGVRTIAG